MKVGNIINYVLGSLRINVIARKMDYTMSMK